MFPLVRSHTCYQGVINVRVFLENVAYARRMILLCWILLAAENTEKKRCSLLQEFTLFNPLLIMLKNGQTYLKIRKIFKVCLAIFQHRRYLNRFIDSKSWRILRFFQFLVGVANFASPELYYSLQGEPSNIC